MRSSRCLALPVEYSTALILLPLGSVVHWSPTLSASYAFSGTYGSILLVFSLAQLILMLFTTAS